MWLMSILLVSILDASDTVVPLQKNLFDNCALRIACFEEIKNKQSNSDEYRYALKKASNQIRVIIKEFNERNINKVLDADNFRALKDFHRGHISDTRNQIVYFKFIETKWLFFKQLKKTLQQERNKKQSSINIDALCTLFKAPENNLCTYYQKKATKDPHYTIDKNLIKALKEFNGWSSLLSTYSMLSDDVPLEIVMDRFNESIQQPALTIHALTRFNY